MSPRGISIPGLKEQLFHAAERVLVRDGPGGLTGRAITREAGVATGLLYNHFADLDGFLAELVLDRGRQAAAGVTQLRSRAGDGSVIANLTEAALSFGARVPIYASLVRSRPALASRVRAAAPGAASVLNEIEAAFAAYLDTEKHLGRIAVDTDTETMALALIATVHHLVATDRAAGPELHKQVHRITATLLAGATPTSPAP